MQIRSVSVFMFRTAMTPGVSSSGVSNAPTATIPANTWIRMIGTKR